MWLPNSPLYVVWREKEGVQPASLKTPVSLPLLGKHEEGDPKFGYSQTLLGICLYSLQTGTDFPRNLLIFYRVCMVILSKFGFDGPPIL